MENRYTQECAVLPSVCDSSARLGIPDTFALFMDLAAIHAEQLENVRHLLRTTSLSITEISRLCNFRSENHLKRLFKQAFGQTMSDYRNAENTNRASPTVRPTGQ